MPEPRKTTRRVRPGRLVAIHPGEILKTEFMDPLGLTSSRLAADLGARAIADVVRCKRPITADLALRLGKYFGTTAQVWMNLQSTYELRVAAATARLGRIKPIKIA